MSVYQPLPMPQCDPILLIHGAPSCLSSDLTNITQEVERCFVRDNPVSLKLLNTLCAISLYYQRPLHSLMYAADHKTLARSAAATFVELSYNLSMLPQTLLMGPHAVEPQTLSNSRLTLELAHRAGILPAAPTPEGYSDEAAAVLRPEVAWSMRNAAVCALLGHPWYTGGCPECSGERL